ncbi:MAG TPA: hypothetical protein VLF89_01325 [Candidatus Saccharimonadales bacterium]|nr:hypothetical protein [Candidatus Saccharimonadales bacterium]
MMSIYTLFTKTPNVVITKKDTYQIVQVHTPKEALSEKEILYLAGIIRHAKSHIFTKEYTENQNLYEIITSCDLLTAVFVDKRFIACGFAIIYSHLDVTYLFSAFVRKMYQQKGIGELMMRASIETKYFVFLTQTTHSYKLLQKISKNNKLYPNIRDEAIPQNLQKRCKTIIVTLPGLYNPDSSIVLLKSGYSSFPKMPISRDRQLNDWMYNSLYRGRKTGEEKLFFCIGELDN